MIGNKEECLDPWLGLCIIFIVCVVLLVAISEHGVNSRHKKTHRRINQGDVRGQTIHPDTRANNQTGRLIAF